MDAHPEWEWVRRCRGGSARAFEPLVRRYEARALAAAQAALGDADEAADAVQEAFVRAYRSLKRLAPGSGFGPWFWTILRNLCRDRLRKARGGRERWAADALDRWTWSEPQALARVEQDELAEAVRAALSELSSEHREVLLLKEWQELSYAEIARTLGTPPGTVGSRLHHARAALKQVLGRRGFSWQEGLGG